MANSKLKLTYFDAAGRAEILRLILTYAGKEFEDNRFSPDKWPDIKPTTPFGQVPIIEIDGQAFAQTVAIANFLAREFKLYGKTNVDALKIDQCVQLVEDFVQEVGKMRYHEPDEVKKAELEKKVKEESAPKYLGFIEKMLSENKGHIACDDVTFGDIVVFDLVTGFLSEYTAAAVEKFPLVKALAEKIGNNDRIKAFKAKHQ